MTKSVLKKTKTARRRVSKKADKPKTVRSYFDGPITIRISRSRVFDDVMCDSEEDLMHKLRAASAAVSAIFNTGPYDDVYDVTGSTIERQVWTNI